MAHGFVANWISSTGSSNVQYGRIKMVKEELLELLGMIIGLLGGLVLIDVDHLLPYPLFHWWGSAFFFVFFGISLYYFSTKKRENE